MEAVATEFESPITAEIPQRSLLRRVLPKLITHHTLLIALIVIGAVLRFSFLDRPPIWFDEAATFGRTSGTYLQMLDSLEEAGFGPVHYSLYWWMKNGCPIWGEIKTVQASAYIRGDGFGHQRPGARRAVGMVDAHDLIPTHKLVPGGKVLMTPRMMRLVPAICGTLMIPAMYWLTRELTHRRRIALIAAALATFSAYLLTYSRDAKMYMELWLFVTLNVASLLWWLRARTWLAWACWIVSGTIVLGLHMLGAMTIAIELVFVIAREWPSFLALVSPLIYWFAAVVELALIGVRRLLRSEAPPFDGPVFTTNLFINLWRNFRWRVLGGFFLGLALMSIGPYGYFVRFNGYVDRIQEVGWHATGVQWIPQYNAGRTGPELVRYAASAFFTSWEWPKPRDEKEIAPRVTFWLKYGCYAMLILAGLCLLPWRAAIARWRGEEADHQRFRWRTVFGVIAWIVLPVYVVYILSITSKEFPAASPARWMELLAGAWRDHLWLKIALPVAAVMAFYFSGTTWKRRVTQTASFMAMFATTFLLLRFVYWIFDSKWVDDLMVARIGRSWKFHGSLWIPRYLGVIVPALFVVSATLIARLPGRIVQTCAVLIFVAINFAQYTGRVFADTEPPVDYMVQDSIDFRANEKSDGSIKMYYSLRMASIAAGLGPGTGLLGMPTSNYYWVIKTNSKADPDQIRGLDDSLNTRFPVSYSSLPSSIKRDVQANKKLTKLIVWDNPRPIENSDKVLDAIGPEWKLAPNGEEMFYAREHWTWRTLMTIRRRVYLKTAVPASQPTTAPTTSPTTWPATMPSTTQSSSR